MERIVKFRDRQELQSDDLNNIQVFARDAIDNVVGDGIEPGKAYAGFGCSKTAATVVTVDAGRLYAAGEVFQRVDAVELDMFNLLPLTTKKRVAIVAWGQEIDTDTQPRDFLIDAQTGQTEPQSVAMESLRRAEISTVAGIEAPDPQYPVTDANVTVIAYVILDTNGVVSIEQWSANQLQNVRGVANRATALENWKSQIGAQVNTLRTDLAALAETIRDNPLAPIVAQLVERVFSLEEKINRPTTYLIHTVMNFYDDTGTNTGAGNYDALVNEGVRFPRAASATGNVALLNPADVNVEQSGGFCIPVYSHSLRIDMTGYSSQERIAQYTYETVTITELTRTRERVRYGAEFYLSSAAMVGQRYEYDPVSNTLKIGAETFEVIGNYEWWARDMYWNDPGVVPYTQLRVRQFWTDTYNEEYWDRVKSTAQISGQQVAQTFLNSQDGWFTQVGLYFSQVDSAGDVEVLVCETLLGQPDLSRVIARTTLDHADIGEPIPNASGLPSLVETKVPLPPTFLKAGKRYGVVLITAGDHYVAMSDSDNSSVQGTYFASTDGAFYAGNLQIDIKMRFYFASWAKNRFAINLESLQLAGGIASIDILNEQQTPGTTKINYEVQVGGVWKALAPDPDGPDLSALPPLLPCRVVLLGTSDVMPGFGLTNSQVILSRPKTTFLWVSDQFDCGSNASTVVLRWRLSEFDDTPHDFTAVLQTGAGPTQEAADTVVDTVLPDGSVERVMTFNIAAAQLFYIEATGTCAVATEPFTVSSLEITATA